MSKISCFSHHDGVICPITPKRLFYTLLRFRFLRAISLATHLDSPNTFQPVPRSKMSFYRFVSLICFLLFLSLNSSVCQGPECFRNGCCANHKEINEPRRSIKSVWESGQIPKCDRDITQGWYRFTSFGGTKMPEKEVTDFHCGTHDPVWLQGSHPTIAEGNVARKACISSFGESCYESFDINIVNCTDYFVYYLKPLYYCASAYCAGK